MTASNSHSLNKDELINNHIKCVSAAFEQFKEWCEESSAEAFVDYRDRHGNFEGYEAFRNKSNKKYELFVKSYSKTHPYKIEPGQIVPVDSDQIPYINKKHFEKVDWSPLKELNTIFKPLLAVDNFRESHVQGNPFKVIICGKPEEITKNIIIDAERIVNDEKTLWQILEKFHNPEEEAVGKLQDVASAHKKSKKEPVYFDPQVWEKEIENMAISENDRIELSFALLPDLITESDLKKAKDLMQRKLRPHSQAAYSLKDDLLKGNFSGQVRLVKTNGKVERAVSGNVLAVNVEWFCENILPQISPIEQTALK